MKNCTNVTMYIIGATILTALFIFAPNNATENISNMDTVHATSIIKTQQTTTPITPPKQVIESVTHTVQKPTIVSQKDIEKISKPKANTYYVISDGLNVRIKPNATSKIIRTMSKNQKFNVVGITVNNWLKLNNGGYVNAEYADIKPVATQAIKLIPQPKSKVAASVSNKHRGTIRIGVTTKSNLTPAQVELLVKGTPLKGIGKSVIEVENKFGINAFFTVAVAKLESGNGKSRLAREKNNIFGMAAYDKNPYDNAHGYISKSHSVYMFGRVMHKGYISRGLTTLDRINRRYSTSSQWAKQVNSIMKSDYKKIKK